MAKHKNKIYPLFL